MGLDLQDFSAVCRASRTRLAYVVQFHVVKLEEAGERANLINEA